MDEVSPREHRKRCQTSTLTSKDYDVRCILPRTTTFDERVVPREDHGVENVKHEEEVENDKLRRPHMVEIY